MITARVADGTFAHALSISLGGENAGEHPRLLRWDRAPGAAPVKVFTDMHLSDALDDLSPRKIALIVESPAFSSAAEEFILRYYAAFYRILTHNQRMLERLPNALFYPFCGSWLSEWGVFEKSKMVSLIVGAKRFAPGHALRHEAARVGGIDAYGEPYTDWMPSKSPALRPYRFSVIIENVKADYFFTEKLIDCISQGTIPIYWGCPSIGDFFDQRGIIAFDTVDELSEIVNSLTEGDYRERLDAARTNFEIAHRYRCAEDWIADRYPHLFRTGGTEQ